MKNTAVLIALLVILCLCIVPANAEDEATVAVRVGDTSYTVEEVQGTINTAILYYSANSEEEMTEEQKTELIAETVESYVQLALLENESARLHLNNFNENDIYTMREEAQKLYDESWEEMRSQYSVDDATDEQISQSMTALGISIDSFYDQVRLESLRKRYLEKMNVNTNVTDEYIESFYEENYVELYEKRYKDNIPLYEEEVLYGDGISLYTPEGYRVIRQIILPIPEDAKEKLESISEDANTQLQIAADSYENIAKLAIAGEDVTDEREKYLAAEDAYEQDQTAYTQARAEVLPMMENTTNEIYGRLETGELFVDLIDTYSSENSVYYWHQKSSYWPDELSEAIQTLTQPGDVSQPVFYDDDIYILYYEKDLEGGAMTLTSEMKEIIDAAAQTAFETEKTEALLDEQKDNYKIETYTELLTAY